MIISAIVAFGKNYQIGIDNQLPWRLSADLKRFKKITMGHHILMGRKTYESIGKPLSGRTNQVLTRSKSYQADGIEVYRNLDDAVNAARAAGEKELFIIGGEGIYRESFDLIDRIYLTKVAFDGKADAFFPEFNWNDYRVVSSESFKADEKNHYDYEFVTLEKSVLSHLKF